MNNTCNDFWLMVWEQKSCLIVSATTLIECGRIKCAKYWPDVGQSMNLGNGLSVYCSKETEIPSKTESFPAMIERELMLTQEVKASSGKETQKETRIITQIHYISWPDHGVPSDCSDFLSLVNKVRNIRMDSVDPVVVHCRFVLILLTFLFVNN